MLIRQERTDDVAAIRAVTAAAFAEMPYSMPPVDPDGVPGEASLVGWLRESAGWIPELSLVAEEDGTIVGHAVATRGSVDRQGLDDVAALGLGPVSVAPDRQNSGIGSALVRGVIAAADDLGEPLMVLLGEPPTTRASASSRPPSSASQRRSRSGATTSRRAHSRRTTAR